MGASCEESFIGPRGIRPRRPILLDDLFKEQSGILQKYSRRKLDLSKTEQLGAKLKGMNISQLEELRADTHRLSRIQLEIVFQAARSKDEKILNMSATMLQLRRYFLEISDIVLMSLEEQQGIRN